MGTTPEFDPERACIENATWLRGLARALVHDAHLAEDIVQDAFWAVVKRPPDARDIRSYLAGTVRFLASKKRREAGRRAAREHAYIAARESANRTPDDVFERIDLMRRVLEELENLPRNEGRVIGMHFVDGLTLEEIARCTGLAPSSVRSALSRGLARLRERFDRRRGGREAWAPVLLSLVGDSVSSPAVDASLAGETTCSAHGALTNSAVSAAMPMVGVGAVMSLKSMSFAAGGVLLAVLLIVVRAGQGDGERVDANATTSSEVRGDAQITAPEASLATVDPRGPRSTQSTLDDARPEGASSTSLEHPPGAQLVDALTGEVVPNMGVIVVSGEPGSPDQSAVRTDAGGRFQLDSSSTTGVRRESFELELRDGPRMDPDPSRRLTVELPSEAPIEISVGPTFRFGPVTTNRLRMMHHAQAYAIGPDIRKGGTRKVGVFRGDRAWVRLRDPLGVVNGMGVVETQGPWTLVVDAMGGLLRGTATIDRAFGIEPIPIELDFNELGSISFKLIQVEGESFAQDPQVEVVSAADGEVHHVQLSEFEEQWIGSLTGVDPGSYAWQLMFAGDPREGHVEVVAGEWSRVGIEAASIAGSGYEIAIDTSRVMDVDLSDWTLRLIDVDQDTRHTSLTPKRSKSAPSALWHASLGALPDGAWLGLLQPAPGYRVVPPIVEVGPGHSEARVSIEPFETRTITLNVTNAETGRPNEGAIAMLMDGMDLHRLEREPQGRHVTTSAPCDRDVTIQVRVAGLEMADLTILRGTQDIDRDVQLRPGWRNCVRVADCRTAEPVEGISVHVDEAFAGTTDAEGVLWLSGTGPPAKVEVGLDDADWRTLFSSSQWKGAVRPDPVTGFLFLVEPVE